MGDHAMNTRNVGVATDVGMRRLSGSRSNKEPKQQSAGPVPIAHDEERGGSDGVSTHLQQALRRHEPA